MISSSAPTAEIGLAGRISTRTSRCGGGCSSSSRGCSRDDRDGFDDEASTLHAVACVDGSVVGTVRLYPLGDGLWKGDRLAVLPDARVHRLGGELVQFAVRTAGALGGSRMIAQVQVPNVRFFERLGWACDGEAAVYRGVMHQPMAIALSGAWREIPRDRGRSVRRELRARVSSKRPHGAQARPRRGRSAPRRRPCPRARRAGSRSSGTSAASARARRRPGGGWRRRRAWHRRCAPSIICSSEPAMPGIEMSLAAWQRPCSATSTSASPSVLSRLGRRSRSAVKKSLVSLMYRPSIANAASRTSPGLVALARSGALREAGAGGRERGRVAERQVPAEDRDAEQVGRPAEAVEHLLRVVLVGRDEHVDDAVRAGAHRPDVGDVRDHRGASRRRTGRRAGRAGRSPRRR